MKITNVEAFILESPFENTAPEGSEEARGVKHCLLLKVSTDEGITGWSDIETSSHVGVAAVEAPDSSPYFEGLRAIVLNEDPFDVERLWDKVYRHSIYYGRRGVAMQLLSGFDIACHDIIGKATGKPLYKIMGGARRERVRAYASTLFRPTPEAIKDACAFYLDRGFTAIKFGWGVFGQDLKLDIKLVEAAREAVGPEVELMVDPGWMVDRSAYDAIALCRALEPYDIYWLEDFMHPENYEGYAKTKAAGVKTRLAAGEQEATGWGFRQLIQQGGIDVVQPDITRCGGFTQIRKILWEAEFAGVDVCPHAWLTDLNTAAALHVNAILPRSLFLEYNVSDNPMLREVIENPVQIDEAGYIAVPDGPGLGIVINESAVKKFCVNR
ncbi:mandelate racemase/muconate lactonizing enzyme family protein [Parapedobacter soli]|uniref:mandelate racemase/muconate lactonizing enzyme family protein n=1 Tax=Parapedobacter soli TaxID=416955 RepID=UPI0021C6354F|nr:mandelate racemase/muconate lactonizing enzyme family protein [Parapedobacter soli]